MGVQRGPWEPLPRPREPTITQRPRPTFPPPCFLLSVCCYIENKSCLCLQPRTVQWRRFLTADASLAAGSGARCSQEPFSQSNRRRHHRRSAVARERNMKIKFIFKNRKSGNYICHVVRKERNLPFRRPLCTLGKWSKPLHRPPCSVSSGPCASSPFLGAQRMHSQSQINPKAPIKGRRAV